MEESRQTSISGAWKDSTRNQKILLGAMMVVLLGNCVVHLVNWTRQSSPIVPNLDPLVMLVIVIFHSLMVKGRRQTAAFFIIIAVASWFFEFIGNNYGWFFGNYKYTEAAGPLLGGVSVFVIFTWCVIAYTSFMLIDWLTGTKGRKKARSPVGKTLWSALVASASATLVCTVDMMSDPIIVSQARSLATGGKPPWYWIDGGPYLQGLPSAMGKDGIPIGNFVGWWTVAFIAIFVFYLFFQRPDRITGKLVNTVPLLSYIFLYVSSVLVALQLNRYVDGMTQVALIGTFSMVPVVMICVVKLTWDYT